MIAAGLVLTFAVAVLLVAGVVAPRDRARRLAPVLAVMLAAFAILVAVRIVDLAT